MSLRQSVLGRELVERPVMTNERCQSAAPRVVRRKKFAAAANPDVSPLQLVSLDKADMTSRVSWRAFMNGSTSVLVAHACDRKEDWRTKVGPARLTLLRCSI